MTTRDEYVEKMKTNLDQWNRDIDLLEAKAAKAKAEAKIEYEEQIRELRQRRDKALEELQKITNAGEGAWEELKSGAETAWNAFKDSLDRAKSKFNI